MQTVAVYSSVDSPRIHYVLSWLFGERLKLQYQLIDPALGDRQSDLSISYGCRVGKGLNIPATGLLSAKGISPLTPEIAKWNSIPVIFATDRAEDALPFDILSAIFYLLTRYEEYLPHKPDRHDRYPPTESLLFKEGLLARPIVDEWVEAFRVALQQKSGADIPPVHPFRFLATYDIDIAYSHKYKGIARIAGACLKALLRADMKQINERTQVLKKKRKDPYDSFIYLVQLHKFYNVSPLYFILCSLKTTPYDKNIHPHHPAMHRIIKRMASDGPVGIHPSYYANNVEAISQEIKVLGSITNTEVSLSRQHYIKLKLPDTYYHLMDNGIKEDFSMGYGSKLGFRAGTGSSFLWYDLKNEQVTALRVHPFCFMDTTAHYECHLDAETAFAELSTMAAALKQSNSTLTTIFHNFSLGTATEWDGWKICYEQFLGKMQLLQQAQGQ